MSRRPRVLLYGLALDRKRRDGFGAFWPVTDREPFAYRAAEPGQPIRDAPGFVARFEPAAIRKAREMYPKHHIAFVGIIGTSGQLRQPASEVRAWLTKELDALPPEERPDRAEELLDAAERRGVIGAALSRSLRAEHGLA